MRSWILGTAIPIGIALAVGTLIAVLNISRPAQPPIEVRPMQLQPTAIALLYVHVDGAVGSPGVYSLPTGGRIFEAIDAAGGATEEADLREINLAAKVADGQKLVIPLRRAAPQEGEAAAPVRTPAPRSPQLASTSGSGALISLNTASQKMLESLPGIGPVTAGKIVQRRTASGPFTAIEQLRDEKLVNASTFERVKALISVD